MMLGTFLTILLVFFMVLATLAVGVFRNASYAYSSAGNALKWAVYAANFNGKICGQTYITADEVTPYFDYAFQKITNTTANGDIFSGGQFLSPVHLTVLDEISAGSTLPAGTVTNQPGFVVSLAVPVFTNPILGLSPLTITVTRFAVSQPMPVLQ